MQHVLKSQEARSIKVHTLDLVFIYYFTPQMLCSLCTTQHMPISALAQHTAIASRLFRHPNKFSDEIFSAQCRPFPFLHHSFFFFFFY